MIDKNEVKDPKKRILTACVKMFIEKGFKKTTMLDIIKEANVSSGTFQNIYHTKDGVLLELVKFMFSSQFNIANSVFNENMSLASMYAIETSIQLAIVEQNENLREIYVEAYTNPIICEYIHVKTTIELEKIFKKYNPTFTSSDFYEREIGTAGLMRAYMAKTCDYYFSLIKKIECFLKMAFDIYHVPLDEQNKALEIVKTIDLVEIANNAMKKLFNQLEIAFAFKFDN